MKLFKKIALYLLVSAIVVAIFNLPVETKQGINYVITTRKIPLYVKVAGFLYRDYQYKELSRRITKDIKNDREKVMAIYTWTTENIAKQPKDFLVVDDHIWNIIVRRYGVADQIADVFTTLASYAGYEAFWIIPDVSGGPVLSFVEIDDKWYMSDIYNRKYFISKEDLELPTPYGLTYGEYFRRIDKRTFQKHFRRADKQKILPRIVFEFKKLFME